VDKDVELVFCVVSTQLGEGDDFGGRHCGRRKGEMREGDGKGQSPRGKRTRRPDFQSCHLFSAVSHAICRERNSGRYVGSDRNVDAKYACIVIPTTVTRIHVCSV
jgi:hypothetical protein